MGKGARIFSTGPFLWTLHTFLFRFQLSDRLLHYINSFIHSYITVGKKNLDGLLIFPIFLQRGSLIGLSAMLASYRIISYVFTHLFVFPSIFIFFKNIPLTMSLRALKHGDRETSTKASSPYANTPQAKSPLSWRGYYLG